MSDPITGSGADASSKPVAERLSRGLAALAVCLGGATAATADPAEARFAEGVDLCLAHARSPEQMVPAFEAAGFAVVPTDEGASDFEDGPVSGFLSPLTPLAYCWIESAEIAFDRVQEIAFDRAVARYGQNVSGPASRGALANGCPSLTVKIGRTIRTLEFRDTGFHQGCNGQGSGGIFFQ